MRDAGEAERITMASRAAIITTLVVAFHMIPSPDPLHAGDQGYRTFRPQGAGRHPAVIFVSGCDGLAPPLAPTVYERRAEHLRTQGYVVIFLDYLGRRGLKTCAGAISHADAARDLTPATAWLKSQAEVDPTRIAAIGWSYGGRVVLEALVRPLEPATSLSRAVVFYPDCRALDVRKLPVPLLMLLGGDDDMTRAAPCQEAVTRAGASTPVKIVTYPGALHAFDVAELPQRMKYGFATIGHDPAAAAAARDEVDRFLKTAR